MTRVGWALGGLLALGALLWLVVTWPTSLTPHAGDSSVTPLAHGEASQAPSPDPKPTDPESSAANSGKAHVPPPAPGKPGPTTLPAPPPSDRFAKPHGPLEEYRARFAAEAHDPAADAAEQAIRAAFEPGANTDLLRSVSCHQTICRVELRWSAQAPGEFIAAMGRMGMDFDHTYASTPLGPPVPDQARRFELFVKRGSGHANPLTQ